MSERRRAAPNRRRIAVATTSRADFGIYQPVLAELAASDSIEFGLIAGGSHLMPEHGSTISHVRASGFPVWGEAPIRFEGGVLGVARMMGESLTAFGEAIDEIRPDMLLTIGDRFEMFAAAAAASPFALPVAHIHGGEETEGAVDNMYRHAMTKMAHVHFCATPLSARRIVQMGEAPENVHVTGAPSLDGISDIPLLSRQALSERFGFPEAPYILTTYHPETLQPDATASDFDALLAALERSGQHVAFSRPNADAAGDLFNSRLEQAVAANPRFRICDNLGRVGYFSAMANAALMVGNSSSGIIEAASFHLAVVNVGGRQAGRERSANVIDVAAEPDAILSAIQRSLSPETAATMRSVENVYGDGHASQRIRSVLEIMDLGSGLIRKRFRLLDKS
ncbi:UDP-N-acetylglucosamine 2-epimerase [Arvimicrobium flavum]|uniref:UDP-N-acetylglucosamine 2-epimerase n=1 Tax=Arvimicrobium flavum TaxID=3393320 RepID=UPI00237BBCB6|nr:UDP-N-acetylglucosamine 2-epimerase [Mesorhizobium shangrilense]